MSTGVNTKFKLVGVVQSKNISFAVKAAAITWAGSSLPGSILTVESATHQYIQSIRAALFLPIQTFINAATCLHNNANNNFWLNTCRCHHRHGNVIDCTNFIFL
jgi:hypothetical protein